MYSIDDYNETIGQFYSQNQDLLKYSPTFCRCEGQTSNYLTYLGLKKKSPNNYLKLISVFVLKIIRDFFYIFLSKKAPLKNLTSKSKIVFSFFDERSIKDGILNDDYFRDILLGENDIVCIYKLINPKFFRGVSYIRLINKTKKRYLAFSEHSFITFFSILKAFFYSYIYFIKLISLKKNFEVDKVLKEILFKEALREIFDGTIYQGYLQDISSKRILTKNPMMILSVWENHPWNRILESNKKKFSQQTFSKGFQHTGFNKKLLQHYPSSLEQNLSSYPDQIICNGFINQKELSKNIKNTDILVGSALRQNHLYLKKITKPKALSSGDIKNIAFAFSWDESNYYKILEELKKVPKQINIFLKFHPMYPNWILKKDFPQNFVNTTMPWEEIAKTCPLILVNDNSLMFEAFFLGAHSVVYEDKNIPELELRDFESPILHITSESLEKINSKYFIEAINNSTISVFEQKYLEKYFVKKDLDEEKLIFLSF